MDGALNKKSPVDQVNKNGLIQLLAPKI